MVRLGGFDWSVMIQKVFPCPPKKKLWSKCPQGTKGPWEMSKWKASLVEIELSAGSNYPPWNEQQKHVKIDAGSTSIMFASRGLNMFSKNLVWNHHDGQLVTGPVKHNHQSSIGWSFRVYSSVLIHYYELQYLVLYMSIELSITYRMCNYLLLLHNFL